MNKLSVTLAILLFAVLAFFGGNYLGNKDLDTTSFGSISSPSIQNRTTDIVGTHVGTSTVGTAATVATTSVVKFIGSNINTAIFDIKLVSTASTTANSLQVAVYGTNDADCDTAATSTAGEFFVSQINWYSVMDHLKGRVHSTTLLNTSSFPMVGTNLIAGAGMPLIFTNLSYQCLKFDYSGVSSTIYVGLTTRN